MESCSTKPPVEPSGTDADGAEQRLTELSNLLADLNDAPRLARGIPLKLTPTQENGLIQARLGIASSIFTALRWKHEPTAKHCLRVALTCSAWVHRIGLTPERRDEIEIAALLHDVGKIGVPDHILTKPERLTAQEMAVMDGH